MTILGQKIPNMLFFLVFSRIFKNGPWKHVLVILSLISASKPFFELSLTTFRKIYRFLHHKGGPFWFRVVKKSSQLDKMKEKKKFFFKSEGKKEQENGGYKSCHQPCP